MPSYLLFRHIFLRWALFAQDPPRAKFVFGKQCRVQWNLVPIGERVARFDAETLVLKIAVKALLTELESDSEAMWQSHFDFFSEEMVRRSVTERVAFINYPSVNAARRQHIRISQIGKTAARKS